MANCRHGGDAKRCAICQKESELQQLQPWFVKTVEQPGFPLVLRKDGPRLKIMSLDGRILEIDRDTALQVKFYPSVRTSNQLRKFHKPALKLGHLFHPSRPLTAREQREEGPSHCYECKNSVSFAEGSLGCGRCGAYVCRCGTCLCGSPTMRNYLGQLMPPGPPLPLDPKDRLEYLRVVRAVGQLSPD